MKFKSFPAILALTVSVISCAGKHSLFESGKSDYTIVIAPESSQCVHYAAQELQYWLGEVSGAELPIAEDLKSGRRGKRIVVGYNELVKSAEEPDGKSDAFSYCSKGGDIFLWGNTDRGTLYSVYSLLENEFGCRWYNARVSLVPKCDSYSFSKLYNSEAPAIRMRNVFYYDIIAHKEFAARVRSNSCLFGSIPAKFGGSEDYSSAHTLPMFVSPEKYYDSHPEYFCLRDGKRMKDNVQLCLSNPDVLKIVTEEVRKTMREHPEFLVYSVSQGDNFNPCECEECRAIKEQYGGEESGIMLWFVNQVADAVKDEFPDKYIGTFAYLYSRKAPKNIKPHDNVVVRLCSIEVCQLHTLDGCDTNRKFMDDLSEWTDIAPHVYIWDYSTDFANYALPLPNIPVLQDKMRRYRDDGAIGIMNQGSYQSVTNAFEDLKAYLLARLQWNPDCDVDAVVKDFTDGFFGPDAGPIMREYLDYEADALARDDAHEGVYANENSAMFTDEYVKRGREFFARAKKAVTDAGGDQMEEYLNRLEYGEVGLCVLETLRNHEQGRDDGALDLIKRVVEREGITVLREGGDHRKAEDYIKFLES